MRLFEERPGRREMQSVIRHRPRGNQRFQKLPDPTGEAPYHLSLDKLLSASQIEAIRNSGSISFHTIGDSGGVRSPQAQEIVKIAMEADFDIDNRRNKPCFFYNLGELFK